MPISIEGKRVVVTGGARGIAAVTAAAFAREGARVVTIDVDDARGAAVAEAATKEGPGTVTYLHADVADRGEIFAAIDEAASLLGGLDSLCCIAGIERGAPAQDITEAEWDRLFAVNVKGLMFCNQAAFPHLKEGGGSIVNFGSDAGLAPGPNSAHYASSKGAVMSFTRKVAFEWGRYAIRVNSLVPAIWTPMYDEHRARMAPEELVQHDAQLAAAIPLGGKLGDPLTDLAPVMVFLVSDASKFITAQIISVNGGAGQVR